MRWMRPLLLVAAASASALLGAQASAASGSSSGQRCFPDDFMFGSATASYQVEGAVNETGRTPSIWDDFCRERPGMDCSNVADDFLHRYKSDIELMKEAGLQSFRFSISWSRVMNYNATTKRMQRNQPGIDFYHDVIDELLRQNLVPILTLYHWDLPSELHTQLSPPGWLNTGISDHFLEFAELMYHEFGRKVDYWTTFNEPLSFASQGYGTGTHAPGFTNSTSNAYIAGHNLLNAHAKAVAKFRELKNSSNTSVIRSTARISIVLVTHYAYPLNATDANDIATAERRIQFMLGWFLEPIVSGDYPAVMREIAGDNLPTFTAEESALLKGSYDLFMLNHYSSHFVTDCASPTSNVECSSLSLGWERDMGVDDTRIPEGARRSSKNKNGEHNCAWFTGYAPGYLETIKWMHKHDTSAQILLTENGWCGNEEIENMDQLWYYQTYLEQVYKAITDEKIPIIGYTAWSFVDNYEWGSFNPRFGLYYVDFPAQIGDKDYYTPESTDLQRIARPAAKWFSKLATTKCLGADDASQTAVTATDPTGSSESTTRWPLSGETLLEIAALVGLVAFVVTVNRRRVAAATRSENSPLLPGRH